jgi:dolichyl-phosphate-mannose-protein mannosyltransferase
MDLKVIAQKNAHWVLLGLSFIVHFFYFGHPNQIVFDEVTFGKFIQASWQGKYYFDLHPPLGKWLLTLSTWPFEMDFNFVFDRIGTPYKDQAYLGMRALTTLCGSIFPLIIYGIMNRIQSSQRISFCAAFFVIFENNLLVVSRFFMLDIFLLFFGFLSLFFYLKTREKFSWRYWVGTSLAATSALLIKWTGASFIAIILFFEMIYYFRKIDRQLFFKKLAIFFSVGFAFYYINFAIHFSLLPNSGQGNDFMSPRFQRELEGTKFYQHPQIESLSDWEKFIELNLMLWRYHQSMHQNHPYSSTAFEWLWMKRPIYYWENGDNDNKARIYLLGNPFLWWAGSIAILFLLSNEIHTLKSKWLAFFNPKNKNPNLDTDTFILILFLANFLPFFMIDRVMFIYHYNVALVVSLMGLSHVFLSNIKNKYFAFGICIIGFLMFLFFAPLSYGLPLSNEGYQLRLWFPSWL